MVALILVPQGDQCCCHRTGDPLMHAGLETLGNSVVIGSSGKQFLGSTQRPKMEMHFLAYAIPGLYAMHFLA